MSETMKTLGPALIAAMLGTPAHASDFPSLDEALPEAVDAASIAPVFDFDTDGCLPSAGISRSGQQNGGLKPSGSLTGQCRSANFLDTSNTVHRHACTLQDGSEFCGHFYALYFEKDQLISGIQSGHRHDWEYAAVWTIDGVVSHGSFSAHGDLNTATAASLAFESGHLKIVYHKEGVGSHALRFATANEEAENPYAIFVTPDIVSWYVLQGDGLDNQAMRGRLNGYDYGAATLPVKDSQFLSNLNRFRPSGYPEFSAGDVLDAAE